MQARRRARFVRVRARYTSLDFPDYQGEKSDEDFEYA